jgi:predicted helicase
LRGNQRTSGERSRREGGKIFGSGSRTPVAIALLVKNPKAATHGNIHFHDIGDYLTREDKLAIIARFGSIDGITKADGWQTITPNEHGDWLGQRDSAFEEFLPMGDKKSDKPKLFSNFTLGVATGRDAWCINPSHDALGHNMQTMIGFYNAELARFDAAHPQADRKMRENLIGDSINTDPTKISWTVNLKGEFAKAKTLSFDAKFLTPSVYRPFTRQWLYYNRTFNERVHQMPRIFPDANTHNKAIMIKNRPVDGSQFVLGRVDKRLQPQASGGEIEEALEG